MRDVGEELAPDVHPLVETSNQIIGALEHIDRHPATLVRWPYPDLDTLTGPMGGGEVWFTAAFSGGGKTTFVVSTIEAWRKQGKKVYVMPLELQPSRFRTYLACMEVGIRPGDALSGQLRSDPTRDGERAALKAAVTAQMHKEFSDFVRISPQRSIDVRGLENGLKEAKRFGADVVIVDHIDHIEDGDGQNLYAESVKVNNAALRMAQDNDLLLWFTSQLNMEIVKGKDHLAKFGPPMQHHLMFPTAKIKNATGIIGLFRPLRKRRPDEDEQDYLRTLKAAHAGEADATDALEPGVMGVTAMKLRNYGQHDGRKILLGVERGRVIPLNERDRYQTGFGGRVQEVYRG
jgi:KaiC/GvpD/RAD55 family RecA-like ATPase